MGDFASLNSSLWQYPPRGSAGQAQHRGGPARGLARGSDVVLAGAKRPRCPHRGPDRGGVRTGPRMPRRRGAGLTFIRGLTEGETTLPRRAAGNRGSNQRALAPGLHEVGVGYAQARARNELAPAHGFQRGGREALAEHCRAGVSRHGGRVLVLEGRARNEPAPSRRSL